MRRTLYLAAASAALAQAAPGVASDAAAGAAFVPMQELVVPIVDGSSAHGRLRVKLVLQAQDAAAMASLQARMPQIRETALIAAAEFARMHASPFAAVDAEHLARDVSAALAAHDKSHVISKVLLVGVQAVRS